MTGRYRLPRRRLLQFAIALLSMRFVHRSDDRDDGIVEIGGWILRKSDLA